MDVNGCQIKLGISALPNSLPHEVRKSSPSSPSTHSRRRGPHCTSNSSSNRWSTTGCGSLISSHPHSQASFSSPLSALHLNCVDVCFQPRSKNGKLCMVYCSPC
ncbi:hypothetical protein FOFC_05132 [Fusarium oxysporum]|nr:hypothetical protein FOFC_05132 [Fusarium oxysporum]